MFSRFWGRNCLGFWDIWRCSYNLAWEEKIRWRYVAPKIWNLSIGYLWPWGSSQNANLLYILREKVEVGLILHWIIKFFDVTRMYTLTSMVLVSKPGVFCKNFCLRFLFNQKTWISINVIFVWKRSKTSSLDIFCLQKVFFVILGEKLFHHLRRLKAPLQSRRKVGVGLILHLIFRFSVSPEFS